LDLRGKIKSSPAARYALAVLIAGLSFLLRLGLDGVFPPGFPYVTFFPAVVVCAYFLGLRPAILCATLCGLAAWWFFIPPHRGFNLSFPVLLTLAFYVFVVAVDIFFIDGMRKALRQLEEERGRYYGFRSRLTNTTLFEGADPARVRAFFDAMMALGVEGMMLSPGYSYAKAPDQEHFLRRSKTNDLFSRMLSKPKKHWKFNQSPLFLQFLMGKHDYECTPWGNPTFNIFGWQRPCYLLQEGYAGSFRELMDGTRWQNYGRRSGNEKCRDCMVHCGFEATAVDRTFSSWKGFRDTVAATLTGNL